MLKSYEAPNIPGLRIFQLDVHYDERGYFKENFNQQQFLANGLPKQFFNGKLQNNVSRSQKGTIRGLHAQPWEKIVSVANGKIFAAWVDLRKGVTFGQVFTLEMDESFSVYVPKGVANSMQALEDHTVFNYLVNDYYSFDESAYHNVYPLDDDLNIPWRNLGVPHIVSDKDKRNRSFQDVKHIVYGAEHD